LSSYQLKNINYEKISDFIGTAAHHEVGYEPIFENFFRKKFCGFSINAYLCGRIVMVY